MPCFPVDSATSCSTQSPNGPHAVMVSLIQNNGVIEQGETVVPNDHRFDGVAAGVYDVRVEGSGVVTQGIFPPTLPMLQML